MQEIAVNSLLDAPRSTNKRLHRIVSGFMQRDTHALGKSNNASPIYWNADFFGLQNVNVFKQTPLQLQKQILIACNQELLIEAHFIEKAGLSYCAKMLLLSNFMEERQAYALMAADEATHLKWFDQFLLNLNPTLEENSFSHFLGIIIEQGDMLSLNYLMQIILEGWGIQHYQRLANACLDPALKSILNEILLDEAIHHSLGVTLFNCKNISSAQKEFILSTITTFLKFVHAGPQSLFNILKKFNLVTAADQKQIFQQLDANTNIQGKLALLKNFIAQPGMEWVVDFLVDNNLLCK